MPKSINQSINQWTKKERKKKSPIFYYRFYKFLGSAASKEIVQVNKRLKINEKKIEMKIINKGTDK